MQRFVRSEKGGFRHNPGANNLCENPRTIRGGRQCSHSMRWSCVPSKPLQTASRSRNRPCLSLTNDPTLPLVFLRNRAR